MRASFYPMNVSELVFQLSSASMNLAFIFRQTQSQTYSEPWYCSASENTLFVLSLDMCRLRSSQLHVEQ